MVGDNASSAPGRAWRTAISGHGLGPPDPAALPDGVGAGSAAKGQAAEGRAERGEPLVTKKRMPVGGLPPAALSGSMQTRPPRSSQAM